MTKSLAKQLPFSFYPTDSEEVTIDNFKISCPNCKEELPETHLKGEITHDTVRKMLIRVKCNCFHCEQPVAKTVRLEVVEGKLVGFEQKDHKWHPFKLA